MDDNDRNAPATKGDVADIVEALREALMEALRDTETKLLNAFYGYAKTNDARLLQMEANETVIRTRMATLESRVMEVERRLNTPPTP